MSSGSGSRDELLAALNAAMRETSGLGVLFSQAVAAHLGVNSADLECLDHIFTRGPLTAGALAEATGLTTGAITGVIDRLEREGFATREHDANDRRKVLVRATPAVNERIAPYFAAMERAAMSVLAKRGDPELQLLLDFLRESRDAALVALEELRNTPTLDATGTKRSTKLRAVPKTP